MNKKHQYLPIDAEFSVFFLLPLKAIEFKGVDTTGLLENFVS